MSIIVKWMISFLIKQKRKELDTIVAKEGVSSENVYAVSKEMDILITMLYKCNKKLCS